MAVLPGHTADLDFTLRRIFKKKTFRPLQREIILAALDGHDVFVQAATSFGKSLCYQLPAVVSHGITICVSPLLSLMKNQVAALQAAGIPVATINSSTPPADREATLADLRCGHPRTRLLYVTPEYCQAETFRRLLGVVYAQRELARIAIDEAHCISEWGHDFRAAYRHLGWFRQKFPDVPIMCLTATATTQVRDDVIASLGLQDGTSSDQQARQLKIFSTTTRRPNIHYEVRFYSVEQDDRLDDLVRWLKGVHTRRATDADRSAELAGRNERPEAVSGIVYATMRAECEAVAARLRERGIGAKPYHAGLSPTERVDCQTRWVANAPGYEVIVATTAFGMGIDKEDVRFVTHWSLPKTFEGFYQEAGRAGRDGRASLCWLYYSREDRDKVLWRLSRELGVGPNGAGGAGTGAAGTGLGHGGGGAGGGGFISGAAMMNLASNNNNSKSETITAHAQAQAAMTKKLKQAQSRMHSLEKLIDYAENTERCRHELITAYFGEQMPPPAAAPAGAGVTKRGAGTRVRAGTGGGGDGDEGPANSSCDFACDRCKDKKGLKARRRDGLATEEWVSTQRDTGALYDEYDCYD